MSYYRALTRRATIYMVATFVCVGFVVSSAERQTTSVADAPRRDFNRQPSQSESRM